MTSIAPIGPALAVPPQFRILTFQAFDLRMLTATGPRTQPSVDLLVAAPMAHRLRPHAQPGRDLLGYLELCRVVRQASSTMRSARWRNAGGY